MPKRSSLYNLPLFELLQQKLTTHLFLSNCSHIAGVVFFEPQANR